MTASDGIVAALAESRLTYEDEVDLHADISRVLTRHGIHHQREVRLDPTSRIDFLTMGGVGIEVKVAGSLTDVTRQMLRYSHSPLVRELLLVTTVARHGRLPRRLGGKPVALHSLIGQGL